jgi:TonB family protein
MTIDPKNSPRETFELPPELADLDRELSSISIEERPSFAPELEAELEKAWLHRGSEAVSMGSVRGLAAAAIGALVLAGVVAPQARASLAKLLPWSEDAESPGLVQETVRPDLPPPPLVAAQSSEADLVEPVTEEVAVFDRALALPALTETGPVDLANRPPEILDREAALAAIRARYPRALQTAGVGGTVMLRLWVGLDGGVDNVQVARGSGVQQLDRAAMTLAPGFRFQPSRRNGVPVGTWVEFPVVFEVIEGATPESPAPIAELPAPDLALPLPEDLTPGSYLTPPPTHFETQRLLGAALTDVPTGSQWQGSLAALLAGEPPEGELPNSWRRRATVVLQDAISLNPDNPAPVLALARIRKDQGLRAEAGRLFEEGVRRAEASGDISSSLRAELYYELGRVLEEDWRAFADLGRLDGSSLVAAACAAAPKPPVEPVASIETLVALNEVCPEELGRVLATDFEGIGAEPGSTRDEMRQAFELAIEAEPAHAGANVQVLLDLADQRRWEALLDRSQAFVWESQGHPHGLLLSGLALERLGRPEQALERFQVAMAGLDDESVDALTDVSMLMEHDRAQALLDLSKDEREVQAEVFWSTLDPILTTEVNERVVEHFARASYALLRFGDTRGDAASVWVRYGRPNAVRTFGEGADSRTEFWDYGVGPDLTFRRPATSTSLELTPESETYLDELLAVLPHIYNRQPLREVRTLNGQVSRFRGPRETLELEIISEVPADLATGPADKLDVAVFLLDGRGRLLSAMRRQVAAVEQPLTLRTQAEPEARQLVLELYNPEAGVAASLRESVAFEGSPARQPKISDLFMLQAADPKSDEVRRTASWVVPNIGLVPEDQRAGVLFELYDLPEGEDYALRVAVEDEDGTVTAVPFRVAGETEYRTTWRRSTHSGFRATEYLTIDLKSLTTGGYTLHVTATLQSSAEEIEATRPVRIREE